MREQEQHELPHALVSRKPESEKGKHPGEKARLGDAEQEAQDIEARRGPREAEREGDQPPRPDDPREPDSRSHAIADQIARNLEDAIAETEQRRPQSIRGFAQPQVAHPLPLRIRHLLPVAIGAPLEEADQPHRTTAVPRQTATARVPPPAPRTP